MRIFLIIIICASLATAAFAQSIGGMSGLGLLVSKGSGSGGGGGGGGCLGAIDLSKGCTLPMLGGL